jgi:hypothetical protein
MGFIGGGLTGDMLRQPSEDDINSGQSSGGMRGGGDSSIYSSDSLSLLLGAHSVKPLAGTHSRDAVSNRNTRNGRVEVELYLFRLSAVQDSAKLNTALRQAKAGSTNDPGRMISKLSEALGVEHTDRLAFTAISGTKTRIMSAETIPIRTGTMQGRGGVRTDNLQNRDIGLQAEIRPTIEQDHVLLAIELSKSDVIDNVQPDNDDSLPTSINWEYTSTVRIDQGRPTVVASSSRGQTWILIAMATAIDRDSPPSENRAR